MDWKDFYPLEKIYRFIDSLEVQFPSTCTSTAIGRTVEGRDIKVREIGFAEYINH